MKPVLTSSRLKGLFEVHDAAQHLTARHFTGLFVCMWYLILDFPPFPILTFPSDMGLKPGEIPL